MTGLSLSCRKVTIKVICWEDFVPSVVHTKTKTLIIKNKKSSKVRFMEMQLTSEKNDSLLAPASSGFFQFQNNFVGEELYWWHNRDHVDIKSVISTSKLSLTLFVSNNYQQHRCELSLLSHFDLQWTLMILDDNELRTFSLIFFIKII